MGYACPVCDDPQADAEHLANHLAFTAMLHGDEHADYLDARVPDWEDRKPSELAVEVVHEAAYVEHDPVFDDTTAGAGMGHAAAAGTGDQPGSGHAGPDRDATAPPDADPGEAPFDLESLDDATLDEETRRVVDEARKLFDRGGPAEGDPGAAADEDRGDEDRDEAADAGRADGDEG